MDNEGKWCAVLVWGVFAVLVALLALAHVDSTPGAAVTVTNMNAPRGESSIGLRY